MELISIKALANEYLDLSKQLKNLADKIARRQIETRKARIVKQIIPYLSNDYTFKTPLVIDDIKIWRTNGVLKCGNVDKRKSRQLANNDKDFSTLFQPSLSNLRSTIRSNVKPIIEYIAINYVERISPTKAKPLPSRFICYFCGTHEEITKEHIIPRWVFNKTSSTSFNITTNGFDSNYEKSVIQACAYCNSKRLNDLEVYIQRLFEKLLSNGLLIETGEIQYLIRWLEIIDYKFQIFNITRKFIRPKHDEIIPFLKEYPLYMLLNTKELSPSKVLAEIRKGLKRISIKSKSAKINSLVLFHTSNPDYYFFHAINDFIFIELPRYKLAVFYFYEKEFSNNKKAFTEANKIIKKVYNK